METVELRIKNMVCERCCMMVESQLQDIGLEVLDVELGSAKIKLPNKPPSYEKISTALNKLKFELVSSREEQLIEDIKHALLDLLKNEIDEDLSLSEYLGKQIAKNYSQISKTFSAIHGQTIERFFINLKIEKATEMISYDDKNFSQIAYYLGYKNLQHLSRQFKQVTGMTMSQYKAVQNSSRKGIDKVWGN
ncbi:AraC family transcriptional regulator [Gracilimonas sediminicola]|uniref:AraC family transcriptional regulator n=1 Tax=Gracilimonas sediminicola TaxID=2952158 RepID=A0A9X2L1G5_9BACT|nr:AraC family transcriptional regulator [Gracilimonas sediminicola]MCP9290565.1 AraC family transcriptional regulator [Gracilimonas sediminicola]